MMTCAEHQQLTDLRGALVRLHKALLDWERAAYERFHGRVSAGTLLQVMVSDPQFAWLRPVSELIVRIDELLDRDRAGEPGGDVAAIVRDTRAIVQPPGAGHPYARRYHDALQAHPDAVFAHRGVTDALREMAPRPTVH
jgi:hypothetical protein